VAVNSEKSRVYPSLDPTNENTGISFYLHELWNHVPVWFNLYTLLMVSWMAIVHFNPSRRWSTVTALLPLLWVFLYYYARLSVDRKKVSLVKPLAIMALVIGVYLIAINVFLKPAWEEDVIVPIEKYYPGAVITGEPEILDSAGRHLFNKGETITAPNGKSYKIEGRKLVFLENKTKIVTGFEISNILWALILIAHCYYFRGSSGLLKFFGAALIYGFLLESGGVTMDFFRENDYHYYFPFLAAPLGTMAGWSTVFYPTIVVYEMLCTKWKKLGSMNLVLTGLLISMIALLWDMHLDPVATNVGLWTWHELLPDFFLGVPLINFTSWLSAVFTFGMGYVFIHRRDDWSEKKKVVAMFMMIPLVQFLAACLNFPLIGIAEGFDGPSWQVLLLSLKNY
jgi:Carotenoid biosynthesis protein